MKKIIILICIFLLTGCSDYVEINDLALISGIAIDYEDNLYKLTTQIIENDKESKVVVLNTASSSIDEAMSEISKLSNRGRSSNKKSKKRILDKTIFSVSINEEKAEKSFNLGRSDQK